MQLNIKIEDTIKHFFQKEEQKPLLSKEEIAKVVENSQRIEGYEPVSKEYELKVKIGRAHV